MLQFLCVLIFIVSCILIIIRIFIPNLARCRLVGSHVLITGGSSGIGRALAEEVFRAGANVTLLARDIEKLNNTKHHLIKSFKSDFQNDVQTYSVDVSRNYAEVENAIHKAEGQFGPVDILINSAGFSIAGKLEDIKIEDFRRLMNLNYFGSLYCTRAVICQMKERRQGTVVFVSSQAGQVGLFGFSGYSASKFALRGLAESLQMEVAPFNVRVCMAFPPDTKTPGYEEEMKTKPLETSLVSAEAGLYEASDVARIIIRDVQKGKFNISVGFEGFFLSTLTSGMSPVTHLTEAFVQILTMGLLRGVSLIYLFKFNKLVAGCNKTATNK